MDQCDQPPEQMHAQLAAIPFEQQNGFRFLDWGPTTDNLTAFIFRGDGSFVVTMQSSAVALGSSVGLDAVFSIELEEAELVGVMKEALACLRDATPTRTKAE